MCFILVPWVCVEEMVEGYLRGQRPVLSADLAAWQDYFYYYGLMLECINSAVRSAQNGHKTALSLLAMAVRSSAWLRR